jgi:hypothetical protein
VGYMEQKYARRLRSGQPECLGMREGWIKGMVCGDMDEGNDVL